MEKACNNAATEPENTIANLIAAIGSRPEKYALFFDIDGTLIDLAATPDAIFIPDDLAGHLAALSRHLNGAVALVTGRALAYADQLFAPHYFPIAGLHGTERRLLDGNIIRAEPTDTFLSIKQDIKALEHNCPGVLVEDKGGAIAAHFRQAPDTADAVQQAMQDAMAKAGPGYELQKGKMVLEIRPNSADKGRAVAAYMAEPPFAGRIPIAFGDDVTDEAMFAQVNALGGTSVRIGKPTDPTEATASLSQPQAVREMIASLCHRI
ncbi:trehalose 6-phosphate phosphatase [Agrobacterium vitis]|nr:trehalose 6-phosphate phosphatase [Agrobacterium vitis]MBE1437322.1 trehalose 6-phosphate phosphatase [Agrobacterium vitis]